MDDYKERLRRLGHDVRRGDLEHPFTRGFLCKKMNHYLDRVYADDRLLHPLIRAGAKGEGRFEPAGWDEAAATADAGAADAQRDALHDVRASVIELKIRHVESAHSVFRPR